MNRTVNMLLGLFFFPTLFLAIFVGFDLPLEIFKTSGANIPYLPFYFGGFALIFFLLLLRRSIRRWVGLSLVGKVKQFKWNAPINARRKSRVRTYLFLEGLVMFSAGLGLWILTSEAMLPAIAFFFGVVDNLIFWLIGKNDKYRVGLSSKALIVADREISLLYFTGLRRVTLHQRTVYFEYIKDLQLHFPLDCIQTELQDEFFQKLEEQVDTSKVFFSKKLKKD